MDIKPAITVGGLNFEWDLAEGRFLFEGQESVLFWTASAMKMFFDSIEEISGKDAANVVLESTGFRQGLVVGEYFQGMKGVSIEEAAGLITNTYASAGWGLAEIKELNEETQTLEVHLKNSWEHTINIAQGKEQGGSFLPAHYAGIFSSLFKQNIWYKVVHHQLDGFEESVIQYFPSEETIEKNIHHLSRLKEAEKINELERLVDEKTRELNEMIKEISSPLIPVLEDIVVVPLLGSYDEARAEELLVKTLQNLPTHKAKYLILDLTGLNNNFTQPAAMLIEKLGLTAAMIGTQTVLVGISAKMSMTITESAIDLSKFNCFQTLQHGIHYALAQNGRSII
ncbi:STAS domain-containing protein [Microbacterium sp. APC 3898]|uniref:STAS domain-containing protein n=1 Tax=Planococcus notacanthi TaxID=3035188 RepID=A0ABT7ZKQ1_9BACL|nr:MULTISPECIES: STAS domain-containing protein [Terrabacteria group]MBF6633463.1 STAS domain-containing protein [Planococcus sp. (in: firmicutes)]MDN3427740.1 STAS domain-containing protein [Planococcus sp. APC 4016]MDN3499292.1 STAS domain-containing protein [Microbacterium sp. APC 3898]